MKKISFGNKEYVKASEVAKRFRYTQDYVGQLCRAKKVDARLVGRTWFVDPDSVAAYRKTKHSTQKGTATNVSLNKQPKRKQNPKPVAPVMRSKTSKATQRPINTNVGGHAVTYSSDSEVSIPILGKTKEAKLLEVKTPTAPATESTQPKKPPHKVKIKKSGSKKTTFTTEKLPEISLSGNLKVKNTSDEIEQKEQRIAAAKEQKTATQKRQSKTSNQSVSSDSPTVSSSNNDRDQISSSKTPQTGTRSAPVNFTPKQAQSAAKSRFRSWYSNWFLVSLFLAACSALAVLSLASLGNISSTTADTSWSLFFDFKLLMDLLP